MGVVTALWLFSATGCMIRKVKLKEKMDRRTYTGKRRDNRFVNEFFFGIFLFAFWLDGKVRKGGEADGR